MPEPEELRAGLPTGAGGPIGKQNAGTWSLLEQEQEFADLQTPPPPPPAPASSGSSKKGN